MRTRPIGAMAVMKNLACYVSNSGNGLEPYRFISANGPARLQTDIRITALALVPDPALGTLDTPHDRVS